MKWMPNVKAFDRDSELNGLKTALCLERSGEKDLEYHVTLTNETDHPVWLEKVMLAEIKDPADFGLSQTPYLIFRSGRQKNDLPGVFKTGCLDERLNDVSSVMVESGGQMQASDDHREIISDHLTFIQDADGNCLAVEFLTGRDQLFQTSVMLDDRGNFLRMISEVLFQIVLDPGERVKTETIRIAAVGDPEAETEAFACRKAALYGSRNNRCPSVFCTWYYYGLTVTYEDVLRNLKIIRERGLPYEVFQIDEGWEMTLGEYEPNHKFPVSMSVVADQIREAGMIPGLWSSPFVAHETASVWKTHPEWILRDKAGNPCLFPMNDTVYYVFDITDPATWTYFRDMYHRFTFEWGYSYHKLDFTRAAVIYEETMPANPKITRAQAYYQAVKAIREGMGESAFFLMCGGLYDPLVGLVDAQRTGSDVLSMWSSMIDRDGRTVPYTVRQSMNRYYMNHWWANDPDALMIRRNEAMERGLRLTYGLLNEEEVKTCVVNQFMSGGILCQTEPLDRIDDDRLMEIRHIYPVFDRDVRLLSLISEERFPDAMDVRIRKSGAHCVCLVNWSDTADREVMIHLSLLSLDPGERYIVCDFYSGEYRTGVRNHETVTFAPLKPHSATVIKIERQAGEPIVIASDGHFTMGAEFERMEIVGDTLYVKRPALFPVRMQYTILLPGNRNDKGGNLTRSRSLSEEETVTLIMEPGQEEAEIKLPQTV